MTRAHPAPPGYPAPGRRRTAAVLAAVIATLLLGTPALAVPSRPDAADTAPDTAAADTTDPSDQGTIGDPSGGGSLRLDVGSLLPKVVTSTSRQITVRGSVTNTGDRAVSDVALRLQLADPVGSPGQLTEAMADPPSTAAVSSPFTRLAGKLEPGQSAPISLAVDLSKDGLPIPGPGIYPLTVNVNGKPDYGGQARLAALNMLLPVRSTPRAAAPRTDGTPLRVTVLWPLAARPTQLGTTASGKAILKDDSLARQLQQGGRLADLVQAGQDAVTGGDRMSDAVCFAVDPELVQAVAAMGRGYVVQTDDGLRGGRGAGDARRWLAQLAETTRGHCVVPIPYADADLVALARAGTVDLERKALDTTALRTYLPDAQLHPEAVWPADGMLDQRTLADIAGTRDDTTALLDPANLAGPPHPGTQTLGGFGGPGGGTGSGTARALTFDPLVTAGLRGESREGARYDGALSPASTPAVASQNGIAALVYRAEFDSTGRRTVVAAPPKRWNTDAEDLDAWVGTVRDLFAERAAVPDDLGSILNAPPQPTSVSLDYPPDASASEIPRSVRSTIATDNARVRDLVGALRPDPATGTQPIDVTTGLQESLLRAASGTWRGNEPAARTAAREATNRLHAFTEQISVSSSRLPVSLATRDSQLPVAVSNGLPVNARVRIQVSSAGIATERPYTEMTIPANNSRTFYLPVKLRRSGRFNVDIRLTTPGGTQLGRQVRLDVSSSAFGVVTLAITGTAFAALILLSGRRIYRRVKAARATAAGQER